VALTLNLFKNYCLFEKMNQTKFHPISGHPLGDGIFDEMLACYFGGARSKGFATLRNVSKLPFFDKIGHAKSVGFRFYSAI